MSVASDEQADGTGSVPRNRNHRGRGTIVAPWIQRKLDVAKALRHEINSDNVVIVSAGVAFYGVLAILPAIFINITLYGLFTTPLEAERQVASLLVVLPGSVADTLETQMRTVAATSPTSLSLGFAASSLALLWTVSNATRALIRAVKIAYDQEDKRSRLEGRVVTLGLTIAVLIGGTMALALIAAVPIWLHWLDPTDAIVTFGNLRWLLLLGMSSAVVGLLYMYAPPTRPDRWQDVIPGVFASTGLWAVTSFGFSIYVSSFGSYNATYGALGAAVVLLLWFWLTALAVILGAELNEVLTIHRTIRRDD